MFLTCDVLLVFLLLNKRINFVAYALAKNTLLVRDIVVGLKDFPLRLGESLYFEMISLTH